MHIITVFVYIVKVDAFAKNQTGRDCYDVAVAFGNDEIAMQLEDYLNK